VREIVRVTDGAIVWWRSAEEPDPSAEEYQSLIVQFARISVTLELMQRARPWFNVKEQRLALRRALSRPGTPLQGPEIKAQQYSIRVATDHLVTQILDLVSKEFA
jgi:hypothetical protein